MNLPTSGNPFGWLTIMGRLKLGLAGLLCGLMVVPAVCGGTEMILLTKRVVGMGGDHLLADGESLWVNGTNVGESHDIFDVTVPSGHLFVIGDNYGASHDSRFWDDPWVREQDVIGIVTRRFDGFREVK